MAKKLDRLTAAMLANPARLKEGRNSDGGNLYLVKKSPSPGDPLRKSVTLYWTLLYRWGGKQIEAAIGPLHSVPLKDARARAMEGRRMLHGSPPRSPAQVWRDARRANQLPSAGAFAQVWKDYVAANHGGWSEKHRGEWTRSFALLKPLHERSCAEIATVDVHAVLEPIWRKAPETASRTRGRIEMVLNRAKVLDLIPESAPNPARWKGHMDQLFSKASKNRKQTRGADGKIVMTQRGNFAALPYADAPAFAARLRFSGSVSAKALEFTMLTAARTNEALGALWGEIDFAARTWTVPLSRMKTGKKKGVQPHVVPLSDRALAILREMKALGGPYVFPGRADGARLNVNALSDVMKAVAPGYTVHGLRSTFRDWAHEKTSFPREIAEGCLSHTATGVEGAYRRGTALDRRRQLMSLWSDYCMGAAGTGADIVAFPAARTA